MVTLGSLMHWTKPLLLSIPVLDEARNLGMQVGDHSFAAYSLIYKTVSSLYGGRPLRALHNDIIQSRLFNSKHLNNALTNDYLAGVDLVVSILTSNSQQISDLELLTQSPAEVEFLERAAISPSAIPLASYLVLKAQCLYIFGQPWMALQALHQAAGKLVFITGHATTVYFLFLESLCMCNLLAKYPTTNAQQTAEDDKKDKGRCYYTTSSYPPYTMCSLCPPRSLSDLCCRCRAPLFCCAEDRTVEEDRVRGVKEGKKVESQQFGESTTAQLYSIDSRSDASDPSHPHTKYTTTPLPSIINTHNPTHHQSGRTTPPNLTLSPPLSHLPLLPCVSSDGSHMARHWRGVYLSKLRVNQAQLQAVADKNPINYQPLYLLVEAERARAQLAFDRALRQKPTISIPPSTANTQRLSSHPSPTAGDTSPAPSPTASTPPNRILRPSSSSFHAPVPIASTAPAPSWDAANSKVADAYLAAINACSTIKQKHSNSSANPHLCILAVASELASRFHLDNGNHHLAVTHIITSLQAYSDWNADRKRQLLMKEFPNLHKVAPPHSPPHPPLSTPPSPAHVTSPCASLLRPAGGVLIFRCLSFSTGSGVGAALHAEQVLRWFRQ